MNPSPDRNAVADTVASSHRNDLHPGARSSPVPTRVLLIDDHPVMLLGMEALCASVPELDVVGLATSVDGAKTAHRRLAPEVVVLPIRLDGTRRGIEVCRWIKGRTPTRVVFFTSFARPVDAVLAMLAGADALVPRTAPAAELIAAIHPSGEDDRSEDWPAGILTQREQDVLHLVLEGLTNPEIAKVLHLGLPTVKTHMRHILRKLDVTDRRELL